MAGAFKALFRRNSKKQTAGDFFKNGAKNGFINPMANPLMNPLALIRNIRKAKQSGKKFAIRDLFMSR